jgi:hypothetical protein
MYRHHSPGAFFSCLARHADTHSRRRLEAGRIEAGICTIDADDISKLWDEQEGLCYYTGFPLQFDAKQPNFASLERLAFASHTTKRRGRERSNDVYRFVSWSLNKHPVIIRVWCRQIRSSATQKEKKGMGKEPGS